MDWNDFKDYYYDVYENDKHMLWDDIDIEEDDDWEALLHDPEPLEKIAKNCTSRIDWEYDYALNGAIEYTARKVARETEATNHTKKKEKDTDFEL